MMHVPTCPLISHWLPALRKEITFGYLSMLLVDSERRVGPIPPLNRRRGLPPQIGPRLFCSNVIHPHLLHPSAFATAESHSSPIPSRWRSLCIGACVVNNLHQPEHPTLAHPTLAYPSHFRAAGARSRGCYTGCCSPAQWELRLFSC